MGNIDDFSGGPFYDPNKKNTLLKSWILFWKKNVFEKRFLKIFLVLLAIFLVVGGGFLAYSKISNSRQAAIDEQQKQAAVEKAKSQENAFVSDVLNSLKDEAKTLPIPASVPRSENFQMREVVFGGFETTSGGEMKDTPLKIYDVRSESLVSKDGKQAKLYISWRTNKLAVSQVVYAKPGSSPNILLEDGVGFSHALIIGKFDFDTRYTYVVKAKDRWGNEAESEQLNAYSGKKADSIITLISNEFKKIFNWTGATN